MARLDDIRLPDELRARVEALGWTLEYLKSNTLPWFEQWDGMILKGKAFGFLRMIDHGRGAQDGSAGEPVLGDCGWSSVRSETRELGAAVLDLNKSLALTQRLADLVLREGASEQTIGRWLESVGAAEIDAAAVLEEEVWRLDGRAMLDTSSLDVTLTRPCAAKRPPQAWQFLDGDGAHVGSGGWRLGVQVVCPRLGAALLAAVLSD